MPLSDPSLWEAHIIVDPDIMGGTPVLRGTRMTIYSVLGRLDGGDQVDDILEDTPQLTRKAIEAAAGYARMNPLVENAEGRPWVRSV